MTLTKLTLMIPGMSKPRGMIGKQGNIYHSSKRYVEWNKDFIGACFRANFTPPKDFHTLAIVFYYKNKRGHLPDVDNMQGASLDALVKGKYLEDDNISIVDSLYGRSIKSDTSYIEIYFCGLKKDFIHLIANKLP
jgi:Holliday junction resolvase RusA-like endonuclease